MFMHAWQTRENTRIAYDTSVAAKLCRSVRIRNDPKSKLQAPTLMKKMLHEIIN